MQSLYCVFYQKIYLLITNIFMQFIYNVYAALSVATCAIFRRKVRYVRSIRGVRWSALRVRSICCVSIKYEFLNLINRIN